MVAQREMSQNFSCPVILGNDLQCVSLVGAHDFMQISLPQRFLPDQFLLCPKEYLEALEQRAIIFN
jgi:hypothetical protein